MKTLPSDSNRKTTFNQNLNETQLSTKRHSRNFQQKDILEKNDSKDDENIMKHFQVKFHGIPISDWLSQQDSQYKSSEDLLYCLLFYWNIPIGNIFELPSDPTQVRLFY